MGLIMLMRFSREVSMAEVVLDTYPLRNSSILMRVGLLGSHEEDEEDDQ